MVNHHRQDGHTAQPVQGGDAFGAQGRCNRANWPRQLDSGGGPLKINTPNSPKKKTGGVWGKGLKKIEKNPSKESPFSSFKLRCGASVFIFPESRAAMQ